MMGSDSGERTAYARGADARRPNVLECFVATKSQTLYIRRALLAFIFFSIVAIIKTYPLILQLGTHVTDLGDPLMLSWVLAWDVQALRSGNVWHFFDANIFYPFERTLAFSEHLLGVVPFFAPGYLITGNPIVGYNIVLLLSFVLSGLSMFCLVYHWTRQFWPSLVAGALFGFAPFRFGQYSHVQILNVFWTPICLLFLDRFLYAPKWRNLVGFAIFYWFQVLSSVYLGYIATVGVTLYAGYHVLVVDRGLLRLPVLIKALAFAVASVTVLLPLHLPYLRVQESWGFVRSVQEVMSYSPDILNYLSAPPLMNDLYLWVFRAKAPVAGQEKWLFPGLVLPCLVVIGSAGAIASRTLAGGRRLRNVLWLILTAAFLLSLGPYLVLFGVQTQVPLPYLLFHYLLPGFDSMRVPGRFVLLALLAASALAALGVIRCSAMFSRVGPLWARRGPVLAAAVVLSLLAFELGGKPFPLVEVPDRGEIRELYHWLNTERPGPIVELPFGFYEDYRYVYFSSAHWLPLVNGLSSFAPAPYDEIQSVLSKLPDRRAVEYAEALGIRAVVLHGDNLPWEDASRWTEKATAHGGLRRIASFGPHIVYSVGEVSVTPSLTMETTAPSWLAHSEHVRLGLLVRGEGSGPWRHPRPHGWSAVLVRWTEAGTGRSMTTKGRVQLPPVIPAGETIEIPMETNAPADAGSYRFEVSVPGLWLSSVPQSIEVRSAVSLTSRDSPRLLAATYVSPSVNSPIVATAKEPIRLEVGTTNVGAARWVSGAQQGKGVVRLGWRWLKDKQELKQLSGGAPVQWDVFPGQSHRFQVVVAAPDEPGRYMLELGLVSERVASFDSMSTPAVALEVEVREAPRDSFANVVERLRLSGSAAPRVTLSANGLRRRVGELFEMPIHLENGEHPWVLDAYLVLEGRRGLWSYDGQRLVPHDQNRSTLLARGVELASGARTAGQLFVPLAGLAPGEYRWYVVLTEAGTHRIIADATARMEVVP
jgi:hypothetical protein